MTRRVFSILIGLCIIAMMSGSVLADDLTVKAYDFMVTGVQAPTQYSEAPELAEMVAKGLLPPVEERLPENPLVVVPFQEIGVYGGTLRTLETHHFWYPCIEELVRKPAETSEYIPNLAEAWDISDDYTTFTFYLRKGVRWSDGTPWTSADIMFWYEDLILNDDYTPAKPAWLVVGGELGKVSAPDEYTVVFEFKSTALNFMESIANYGSTIFYRLPKHYLQQFHPSYVSPEKLAATLREAGVDAWHVLLEDKSDHRINPDLPVLSAWKLTTHPQQLLQVAERNPYYWKVDTEGNQLPYISKISWDDTTDQEVKLLRALAGQVDLAQVSKTSADIPLLRANERDGNYTTVLVDNSGLNGAGIVVFVNQTFVGDPEIAELLQNVQFRRAISHAINRDEVNEFTALGLAPIRQSVLNELHPASGPEFSQAYIEYDPATANRMLDEIGLNKRDSDGFRLLPSGKPLLIVLTPFHTSGWRVDAAEIIKPHFEDVGIKTIIRPEESSLWVTRSNAGEHMISVYANSNGNQPLGRPLWYFPVANRSYWAPLNGLYTATGGTAGWKPEAEQARLVEIYNAARDELDEDVRNALIREAMELHAENLWQIGVIGYSPFPVVRHNRVKNAPDIYYSMGWNSQLMFAEQYYIAQ